jgi:hypothetical protein
MVLKNANNLQCKCQFLVFQKFDSKVDAFLGDICLKVAKKNLQ